MSPTTRAASTVHAPPPEMKRISGTSPFTVVRLASRRSAWRRRTSTAGTRRDAIEAQPRVRVAANRRRAALTRRPLKAVANAAEYSPRIAPGSFCSSCPNERSTARGTRDSQCTTIIQRGE